MNVAQQALNAFPAGSWRDDWMWGLPLIVLTVLFHTLCLGLINHKIARFAGGVMRSRHQTTRLMTALGLITLFATCLHGFEATMWATAYRLLDALPDNRSSMLFSLSSITSYGNANLDLKPHWQLMGALESLNGWLLFGLTTAFLFGMVTKAWTLEGDQ
jgi:hypothetical protein